MMHLRKSEWVLLGVIFVYSFVPSFGGLVRVAELAGGLAIIPENPRALASPLPVVIHIVSSSVFCLVGAVQFLPSIRRQFPAVHRSLGRLVAVAGCASAASGVWMTHAFAFPAELQGALLSGVRTVLGLAMIASIGWAVLAIRARNLVQHRAFMLRAYAIGQGASTQAVLGLGWMVLVGEEPQGLARDSLMVCAWALNLLAAELTIWRLWKRKAAHPALQQSFSRGNEDSISRI